MRRVNLCFLHKYIRLSNRNAKPRRPKEYNRPQRSTDFLQRHQPPPLLLYYRTTIGSRISHQVPALKNNKTCALWKPRSHGHDATWHTSVGCLTDTTWTCLQTPVVHSCQPSSHLSKPGPDCFVCLFHIANVIRTTWGPQGK